MSILGPSGTRSGEHSARRSLTLHRVALGMALVAAPAASARAQERSFIDTVRQSGFIFVGTVKPTDASTAAVAQERKSTLVTVDRVLESLPPVGNPTGRSVLVRLRDPGSVRPGDRAVFFTYVQSAGTLLGLVEVGSKPADQAEALPRQIREARQAIADEALASRLASAELVVVGVFGKGTPTEGARTPTGEHDPLWWRAPIQVSSFEKGQATSQTVYANYAHGDDVVWERAPKPKEGEEGIYLLQPDREKRFRASGLFLVDPLDALPKTELERVRRLLSRAR